MRRGARSGIAAAAYAAALLMFGLPGLSEATTVSVSDEAEYRTALTTLSGDGSGPHTINVTADITIDDGTDPIYDGTQPLTINGNGFTLDAASTSRVLFHNSSADLMIDGLTVTGGTAVFDGGGIFSSGSVTVTNSTVSGNSADFGGGILAFISVTVTNSTVSGNTATGAGNGGGILAFISVTVTNSTVSGNSAGVAGGGIFSHDSVTLTNSTVSGNTGAGNGGGILARGSATVTNSTISGNSAGGAGGGIFAAGTVGGGSMSLTYATVVDNSAPSGANVDARAGLTSFGSVVALPQGGGNCSITGGTTSTYGYDDDGSCGFTGTGDTSDGPDPNFGALADNGGLTQTRLPQPGSLLIDAIPVADCHDTVTDDQRDVPRPQDGDQDEVLACDIGGVEVEGPTDGNGDGRAPAADAVSERPSFTG